MTATPRPITAAALARRIARAAAFLGEGRITAGGREEYLIVFGVDESLAVLRDSTASLERQQAVADEWTSLCRRHRRDLGLTSWLLLWPAQYLVVPAKDVDEERKG
jgi:hypothetical protein